MRRVLVFIAVLFASVAPLFAQGEQSGAIRGRLSSSDGLALPGAVVTVVSPSLQGDRSAVSDTNGVYSIPGLPPGIFRFPGPKSHFRGRGLISRRPGAISGPVISFPSP